MELIPDITECRNVMDFLSAEGSLEIIDHLIEALEFVSLILIEVQSEADNLLDNFHEIIINEPNGQCQLADNKASLKRRFKNQIESLRASTKPMGILFFPPVNDYSGKIKELSQEFMDMFKSQMVDIIDRLNYVIVMALKNNSKMQSQAGYVHAEAHNLGNITR